MNEARRLLLAAVTSLGLTACTHNNFMPNVIQLNPNGTAINPAKQSIASSFTLTAVEDGYTGPFTADTVSGNCWVVQVPISTSGAWIVVPQGLSCANHETDRILVKDTKGNSASTYIRGTGTQ
ncbi:MAG: hypothetical protein WCC84_12760 [Candidatus Cybelea sp.]